MKKIIATIVAIAVTISSYAAACYVDRDGICRWSKDGSELTIFATNYCLPFSSSYRLLREAGESVKEAIVSDVYHMARMGFDGYRLHVWESEISDEEGNIIDNEQLKLLDFLLAELKSRDIKVLLTPLNFYEDNVNKSFTNKYKGKRALVTDQAHAVHERYLQQFVNHVNSYTGEAYKDDDNIIAFELCNEPNPAWGSDKKLHDYVERMRKAVRATGTKTVILFNLSSNFARGEAITTTKVDGITCQWYPTGLFERRSLYGNFHPHVDSYNIEPLEQMKGFSNKARFIYEYSPSSAAAAASLFPAMARSFREAGFQFAAYFSYDEGPLAYLNYNYPSHLLSLPFTPREAVGMKIAGELFRDMPRGASYGRYPANCQLLDYRIDPTSDYAELNAADRFYHTDKTSSAPRAIDSLKHIAAVGGSAIVDYEGSGVYFLDRLDRGVWRLEVMPDATAVADPMCEASMDRDAIALFWGCHHFVVRLPELGSDFTVEGLNNNLKCEARAGGVDIFPGVYLLKHKSVGAWSGGMKMGNISIAEYHAPRAICRHTTLTIAAADLVSRGEGATVGAKLVTAERVDSLRLCIELDGGQRREITMRKSSLFGFEAVIPQEIIAGESHLSYNIKIFSRGTTITHDVAEKEMFIVEDDDAVVLFDTAKDYRDLLAPTIKSRHKLQRLEGEVVSLCHLVPNGVKRSALPYTVIFYAAPKLRSRALQNIDRLEISGYAPKGEPLWLDLVLRDGTSYGTTIYLDCEMGSKTVALEELHLTPTKLSPQPYPSFQHREMRLSTPSAFDINELERLQFSVAGEGKGVYIGRVIAR